MIRKRLIPLLTLVALLPACSGIPEGKGRLILSDRPAEGFCCVGDEGEVVFAEVTGPEEPKAPVGFGAPNKASGFPETEVLDLDPGKYNLRFFVRTCAGTCARLDPPFPGYECQTQVNVNEKQEVKIEVVLDEGGCTPDSNP